MNPELKTHLETIEKELIELRKGSLGFWSSLFRGMFYGAGYVIGAALIIVIIGWILNILGVLPAIGTFARQLQDALDQLGKMQP